MLHPVRTFFLKTECTKETPGILTPDAMEVSTNIEEGRKWLRWMRKSIRIGKHGH